MKRVLAILLALGGLVVPAVSGSGSGNSTRVLFDEAYPPYMYGSGDAVQGLYPAIIKTVFQRTGIEIEAQGYPWDQALHLAEKGDAAIGGLYKNEKRLKSFSFSDPIETETLGVYVRRGAGFPFHRLSDLRGKTVGLNRGWSYGDAIDDARAAGLFSVEESADDRADFEKLMAGKVDCIFAEQMSASEIIRQQQYGEKVERLAEPAAVNAVYVAFAKGDARAAGLEGFNAALRKMKQDGSYGAMLEAFTRAHRLDQRLLVQVEKALDGLADAIGREPSLDKSRAFTMLATYLRQNPEIYGAAFAFAPRQQDGRTVKSAPYVFRSGARLVEKELIDSYDYTAPEQAWYVAPVRLGKPVWTEPYFDKGGGDVWMRTYSIPIYSGGAERRLIGIVTSDVEVPSP